MQNAVDYISATPLHARKNGLDTIRAYLERTGHPGRGLKVIHIAGTNGKGSVASRIAAVLREAGFKTGLFISPHLCDIRERMSVNGEMISEEEFLNVFRTVRKECESAVKEGLPHLLYFEFLFLMAMLWFEEKQPDYLVLETGLGGRLDATNAIDDKVMTVITRIGLDHTFYLGDTLEKIAAEKAGILRKGCPAVFLTEPVEAYRTIRKAAEETGAPVFEVSRDMWEVERADENGIDFLLRSRYDNTLRVHIPDRALYQCENSALAAAACGLLFEREGIRGDAFIKEGIGKCFWPGRMQEIKPGVFIDGAHNPDGIRAFLESVAQIAAKDRACRRILLFSCVKDKDYSRELGMIGRSGLFTDIVSVPMSGSRALSAQELRSSVSEHACGVRTHEAASVRDAVNRFILCKDNNTEVFAAGSLYFAGELIGLLGRS